MTIPNTQIKMARSKNENHCDIDCMQQDTTSETPVISKLATTMPSINNENNHGMMN